MPGLSLPVSLVPVPFTRSLLDGHGASSAHDTSTCTSLSPLTTCELASCIALGARDIFAIVYILQDVTCTSLNGSLPPPHRKALALARGTRVPGRRSRAVKRVSRTSTASRGDRRARRVRGNRRRVGSVVGHVSSGLLASCTIRSR